MVIIIIIIIIIVMIIITMIIIITFCLRSVLLERVPAAEKVPPRGCGQTEG